MFTRAIPIKGQRQRILGQWWCQWQHSFGIFPSPSRKTQSRQITKQKHRDNIYTKLGDNPNASVWRKTTNSHTTRVLSASVRKKSWGSNGVPHRSEKSRPIWGHNGNGKELCLLQQQVRTRTWNEKGMKGLEKSKPQYPRHQPERTPFWDRPTLSGNSKKWNQIWAGQK